jgi:hypothetical protein
MAAPPAAPVSTRDLLKMKRLPIWLMTTVLAAGAAFAARPPEPPACSSSRIFGVRAPLFMLATARTDTVRAGPGTIGYEVRDTAALASIHGQRFRLDRLGGDVPAELAALEGSEAVLVPYGSHCGDAWRWREARWAAPGAQVFVDVTPRPREQWVDGRPTFDVDMVHDRYPEGYRMYRDSAAELMTPGQLFDLTRLLPTFQEMETAPMPAYRAFLAWARANPGLASRYPATAFMEVAQEALQPCVPAYDPHPAAGTYRAAVIVEETDTLTVFLRTDAKGYPGCAPAPPRLDLTEVRPWPADTARLYVHGGADEAAIPADNREANQGRCGVGLFDVVNRPRTGADGRRTWEADYNYLVLPGCFPDHPQVRRATEAAFQGYAAGARDGEPGRFAETPEGGMRFEQAWRVDGRVVLRVVATRIGPRTLPYH